MKVSILVLSMMLLSACGQTVTLLPIPKNGTNGSNGHSAAFSQAVADISVCPTGGTVLSVGVDLDDDSLLQPSEVTGVVATCNGLVGATGSSGADGVSPVLPGFVPVAILDPCGTNPGLHNEVFMKLANGMVLASFSDNANGLNTRISVLTPGTYQTTDGDGCTFTINALGVITNENKHY
jgi:hypothetical protein